jgi:hypothetical protein
MYEKYQCMAVPNEQIIIAWCSKFQKQGLCKISILHAYMLTSTYEHLWVTIHPTLRQENILFVFLSPSLSGPIHLLRWVVTRKRSAILTLRLFSRPFLRGHVRQEQLHPPQAHDEAPPLQEPKLRTENLVGLQDMAPHSFVDIQNSKMST